MMSIGDDPPLIQMNEDNVRELKDNIRLVDHSLTGMVLSIDSMQASCKVMLEQLAAKEDRNDFRDKKCVSDGIDSVKQVLQTIEESVDNQKFVTVKSLSTLLHSIARIFGDLNAPENIQSLSVDQYLRDKSMLQFESGISNCELRLREEVNTLREINKTSDEVIENLRIKLKNEEDRVEVLERQKAALDKQLCEIELEYTEKKKIWLKEKAYPKRDAVGTERHVGRVNTHGHKTETVKNAEQLTEKITRNVKSRSLQEKSETEQTILKRNFQIEEPEKRNATEDGHLKEHINTIEEMKKTIARLESELQYLKTKKKYYVQIYQKGYNHRIGDDELKISLQNWIRSEECQLEFLQCWVPSDIRPNTPLLIVFEGRRVSPQAISERLEECKAVEPWVTAVLIFHNSESDVSSSSHIKEEIGHIGGIYDIVFSERQRQITSSNTNTKSLQGILDMIKTAGSKTTQV